MCDSLRRTGELQLTAASLSFCPDAPEEVVAPSSPSSAEQQGEGLSQEGEKDKAMPYRKRTWALGELHELLPRCVLAALLSMCDGQPSAPHARALRTQGGTSYGELRLKSSFTAGSPTSSPLPIVRRAGSCTSAS